MSSKRTTESELAELSIRNERFATAYSGEDLNFVPKFATTVLTCTDARIDPAHFLQMNLGDVLVLRNIGGRVTESVENDLAILSAVASTSARSLARARRCSGRFGCV